MTTTTIKGKKTASYLSFANQQNFFSLKKKKKLLRSFSCITLFYVFRRRMEGGVDIFYLIWNIIINLDNFQLIAPLPTIVPNINKKIKNKK